MQEKTVEKSGENLDIFELCEDLCGLEFKFIREAAGLTQDKVAKYYKNYTKSAICYWEKAIKIGYAQASCLKDMVGDDMWRQLRKKWRDFPGDKKDIFKLIRPVYEKRDTGDVVYFFEPGKAYECVNP